jgi:hypothetical protein
VNLKIIEVVVLMVAGICFVAWQFHDLRRARAKTREQREAEQALSTNPTCGFQESHVKSRPDGS